MMKFQLLIFLLILKTNTGNSQIISQEIPVYEPVHLQEDFAILKGTLEDFHAGLYWYTSKNEMDSIFEHVNSTLTTAMDELSYFRKLAPVISNIRCGHSWIAPSEASIKVIQERGFLPLEVKLVKGRVYCFRNYSSDSLNLKSGHQILKINGISIDSLIELSNSRHPGDGFITTGKLRLLERYLRDIYALHIGQPDVYKVEYLNDNDDICTITIEALPDAVIEEKKEIYTQKKGNLSIQFLDSSTAVLEVKEFSNWKLDKTKMKFKKELKRIFLKIDSSAVGNLIIDLRNNGGGDDNLGLNLFSYFSDKPIIEFSRMEFRKKKSKYFKYSNMNGFKFWLMSSIGNRTKKINDSTYILKSGKTLNPYKPSQPKFEGSVYVLINGGSFSTTADFAALMKSYDKAIFIGEETGGGYYGNTSGFDYEVTLPNTKLRVLIPGIRYTTNVKPIIEFGRGSIPDYQVSPSIQDEVDAEMNFILEIINKKTYNSSYE